MKKTILCLDGTWNSAYAKGKREDGSMVIKPSNVLKLARSIKPIDIGAQKIVFYKNRISVYFFENIDFVSKQVRGFYLPSHLLVIFINFPTRFDYERM